jgi:hypothetical protein
LASCRFGPASEESRKMRGRIAALTLCKEVALQQDAAIEFSRDA